jgi:hypothetical protein
MRGTARLRAIGRAALTAAVAAAIAACGATKQAPIKSYDFSGFLGSGYARLQPGGKGEADLRWVNPDARWSRYDAVMIDPVTFFGDDTSKVSPPDQQLLCNYFYGAIREAFAKKFQVVDQPGPGVMKLQVAVTDVAAATPGLRTISTVVPQLHALNTAQSLATGKLLFVGGAQVEGKVTDSMTGELLAEAVDREVGGGRIDTALQWEWGDAENAMNLWATTAAHRLYAWRNGGSTA